MRETLNGILTSIGASSLTDAEWADIEFDDESSLIEQYNALFATLITRESVSSTIDRLKYYFQARGAAITVGESGRSNIFVGSEI